MAVVRTLRAMDVMCVEIHIVFMNQALFRMSCVYLVLRSVYACIESFTDLVSLISDIWLLW